MNTATEARQASSTVMTITFAPFRRSTSTLKNSPALNAINASATSERKSVPSMMVCGITFKQHGPIKMPARI